MLGDIAEARALNKDPGTPLLVQFLPVPPSSCEIAGRHQGTNPPAVAARKQAISVEADSEPRKSLALSLVEEKKRDMKTTKFHCSISMSL